MPPKPRVVADSNVIISAAFFGGTPERVLHLARAGTIELVVSPFIVDEVTRILGGPKFRWDAIRIADALSGLPATLVIPTPRRPLHVVHDEADNRVLECAVAARASHLVSGDRELLALGRHFRTRILTPRAFLEALGRAGV
jgi:putative PIN family toxin of toxin-antitoxin system